MCVAFRGALRSFLVLWLLVALALAAVPVATAAAEQPGVAVASGDSSLADSDAGASNESLLIESNTTFVVEIQTDGDAEWTVTERFNLSSELERQAFDDLAAEFESGDVDGASLGFDAFQRAGELVDAETDRDVAVVKQQRATEVEDDVGTLSLSFTWENFARSDGDRLVLDDVYETEHGLWFEGLTASQELIIRSPAGFGFDDANVVPEQGQLTWDGPATFTNETLQAVLTGNGDGTGPGETPTQNGTTPGGSGIGSSLALVLGGIGAVAAAVALAVMTVGTERVRRLLGGVVDEKGGDDTDDRGPVAATEASETDSESDVDLELLSDEERVERLLEQNGGRMKQATIVKETGWSNAKVSQLLSSMEEEDRIDKLRIGRENLISFPDEDITEIGEK